MSNSRYHGLMLVGMLMAAHGGYWFFGGSAQSATELRNAAVGVQIAVGLAVAAWTWWRTRQLSGDSPA